MSVKIQELSPDLEQKWQDYVYQHPDSYFASDIAWKKIIKNNFGHDSIYLVALNNNSICGTLPLFNFKSLLFGNSLVSVPYLNGGGIIADNRDVELQLLEKAKEYSKKSNSDYLELRCRKEFKVDLYERRHKVAMNLVLPSDSEDLFNSFPSKLRSQIRRALKESCNISITEAYNEKAIKDFYQVFSTHMRDLGTPVYPINFFKEVVSSFNNSRTIIVSLNNKPISAAITVGMGKRVEIPWASSLRQYNKFSPNMLLYWSSIKQAVEDSYLLFDFGRSTVDSGNFHFKKQWGADPQQLYWYYHVNKGSVPDVNPKNPKYQLAVKIWQKLPLFIANKLGPYISSNLP